jgi:hypothetical protein
MGYDTLRIRDVSRLYGRWVPPIGAMGGPPAHELYTDLVVYAGLELFRDNGSRPWVVLRDGAHRHAFPVPSPELRGALDRFRMRRNVRPLPEADIVEFVRIIEARASDPDVEIPTIKAPVVERAATPQPGPQEAPSSSEAPPRSPDSQEPSPPVPTGFGATKPDSPPSLDGPSAPMALGPGVSAGSSLPPGPMNLAISGARQLPSPQDAGLARYVRSFRRLLRDGDWMGTTRELSEWTGDEPLTLYGSMLRYRSGLADNDILLSYVEVGESFRWLVVDRTKVRNPAGPAPVAQPILAAR